VDSFSAEGGVTALKTEGRRNGVLIVLPASEQPTLVTLERLTHEYSLRNELDGTPAVRPLELVQDSGRPFLVLEDPGGELLSARIGIRL
jgi:hypothetical protein